MKLASSFEDRDRANVYILDEPTTGLHFADIEKLLEVLQRLVDAGNTVLVIEHNLDVIKQADWIIDLGPEGGEAGGEVLATGTPEQVAKVEESATGRYLSQAPPKKVARPRKARRRRRRKPRPRRGAEARRRASGRLRPRRSSSPPAPRLRSEGSASGRHSTSSCSSDPPSATVKCGMTWSWIPSYGG